MPTFVQATCPRGPKWEQRFTGLWGINLDLVTTVRDAHFNDFALPPPGSPALLALFGGPEENLLGFCTRQDFHDALAAAPKQLERIRETLETIEGILSARFYDALEKLDPQT